MIPRVVFHRARVAAIVDETADARSFSFAIPDDLAATFRYRAGQFCTFRVTIDGEEHLRSYSMSSAPEVDERLAVTVKRVPGGRVSNWLLENVRLGDELELTQPMGVFCLRDRSTPIVAYCGGSGVTPVMAIAKSALVTTDRPIRILCANRDAPSVIFHRALAELVAHEPDRLTVVHHLDRERGLVDRDEIGALATGALDADFYICGPGPFMALVESTLTSLGVGADQLLIERFTPAHEEHEPAAADAAEHAPPAVTIILKGRATTVAYQPGDTLLETARRGGLQPPFSCEAGNCATCMAVLREGSAVMRANDALTDDEVAEGWVLTCQAVPNGGNVVVEYEPM